MFAKLLKNEFRATRNAMTVLCLTALGAGVLGGCAMGYLMWASTLDMEMNFILTMCILVMVAAMICLGVCGVGALFLMIARFYKSRFTDEGYLTFTLPVTTHQVLLSSLVSSGLNMLLTFVVVFCSFVIMMLVGMSFAEEFWPTALGMVPELWNSLCNSMTWEIAGYLALVLGDILAGLVYELVLLMLSVTIGALIAKKHKILAAVGAYYGINMLLSIFSVATMTTGLIHSTQHIGSFAYVLIFFGVQSLVIALIGYFLTHYLITHKLNLP